MNERNDTAAPRAQHRDLPASPDAFDAQSPVTAAKAEPHDPPRMRENGADTTRPTVPLTPEVPRPASQKGTDPPVSLEGKVRLSRDDRDIRGARSASESAAPKNRPDASHDAGRHLAIAARRDAGPSADRDGPAPNGAETAIRRENPAKPEPGDHPRSPSPDPLVTAPAGRNGRALLTSDVEATGTSARDRKTDHSPNILPPGRSAALPRQDDALRARDRQEQAQPEPVPLPGRKKHGPPGLHLHIERIDVVRRPGSTPATGPATAPQRARRAGMSLGEYLDGKGG